MKNKKFFIGLSIFILLFSVIILFNSKNNKYTNNETINKNNIEKNKELSSKNNSKIEFLKSIKGVKAKNIELIGSPVGLDGEFLVPREAILNGVNYFFKRTKNDKIDDINVDIGEGYIDFSAAYKLNENIKTPVMIRIYPTLDDKKNLVLNIDEVRFLDLKLYDWLVDFGVKNIIKDLFSNNTNLNIDFKEGFVIIYKENFDEITLNKLKINSDCLIIDMFINLEKII